MFKLVRVVATILLFASIVLVFIGAFVLQDGVLCISKSHQLTEIRIVEYFFSVFVIIEYLAYTWYTLVSLQSFL